MFGETVLPLLEPPNIVHKWFQPSVGSCCLISVLNQAHVIFCPASLHLLISPSLSNPEHSICSAKPCVRVSFGSTWSLQQTRSSMNNSPNERRTTIPLAASALTATVWTTGPWPTLCLMPCPEQPDWVIRLSSWMLTPDYLKVLMSPLNLPRPRLWLHRMCLVPTWAACTTLKE